MEIFTLVFLTSWFAVSIIWQFRFKKLDRIKSLDILGLFPNWTFFAPNPGTSDYHIVYRLSNEKCITTNWQEMPLIKHRTFYNFIWNPQKKKVKLLIDCVGTLVQLVQKYHEFEMDEHQITQNMCTCVPYLLILNAVNSFATKDATTFATHIQFALIESFGLQSELSPKPLLCSPFHKLNLLAS